MKRIIWKTILGVCLTSQVTAVDFKTYAKFENLLGSFKPAVEKTADDLEGITIVTVGSDNACDYRTGTTKITDAIDDGYIHIRVASGTYTENIAIVDKDMTIEGGYSNCSDAENNIIGGSATVIDGSGDTTKSIVTISGSTEAWDVTLNRLTIRNGGTSALTWGGGISVITSDANVLMQDLIISNNSANFGGGIGVFAGSGNINMYDTNLISNAGQSGGGISCNSTGTLINFYDSGSAGKGTIWFNQATMRNGGGVELLAGCEFVLYSGQDPDNGIDFRGILSNSAVGHGGGVFASGGSVFTAAGFQFLAGNNEGPATIRGNSADSDNDDSGDGGGIYITGENTTANIYNANIMANSANNGGGVAVYEGAQYVAEGLNVFVPCWNPGKCNVMAQNIADASGGALYSSQSDDLNTSTKIYATHMTLNEGVQGSATHISGANNNILIEGSMIYKNIASVSTLYNFNGTFADYRFNSIADNEGTFSVIRNWFGSVTVGSSIIHQTDALPVYTTGTPVSESFDCLITHETDSFTSSWDTAIVDDPEFIDRANDDYHINAATSPAVDYCDGFTQPDKTTDIDSETRGWDDYTTSNIDGAYDIGADETYQNDVIFEDDLE